jgi:hypothetical protein
LDFDLRLTNVTILDGDVLGRCRQLAGIALPVNLVELGAWCLGGTALKALDLSQTMCVGIGSGAFRKCGDLREVVLPATLRWLGYECFQESGLASLNMRKTAVGEIRGGAFRSC